MENDIRIRLIKNRENRKILYSKSMAALNANGKYIIQLDQDDMFIRDDAFDLLYYEAEINNLDLVQIRDITINNYHIWDNIKVNYWKRHFIFKKKSYNISHYEKQPFLKNSLFKEGNIFLLWGLLIKTDIYKKSIYYLWSLIMNYQMIIYEDYTITSIIVLFSKKYKYLNNFALIHIRNKNSAMYKYKKEFTNSVLFLGNNIYNYIIKNNPQDINICINLINRYRYTYRNSFKMNYKFFVYNIRNIISSQYISNKDRQIIFKKLKIKYKQYKKWINYEYFMNYSEYKDIFNFHNINNNDSKENKFNILNPKITIIIFCFDFNYLKKTINSILNQKHIILEIILINDNIIKNNLNIIKNYIRKYKNIKYLSNKYKKGMLYSYSKGVLESKGEFILLLKSGDTLTKDNILSQVYNSTINNKNDILEFNLLINGNENINSNSLRLYICKHIKSEIILPSFKYNKNYKEIDQEKDLINNKLIRSNLLKDIIKKYNLNKYKNKIYNYFDEIILFLIYKEKRKFIHINNFGVILLTNNIKKFSEIFLKNEEQKINDSIFYINFLFENTRNNFKEKKIVLYEFYNILSIIYNKFNKITKTSEKLYKKFLYCKFIEESEKTNLKFYISSLLN